MLLKQSTRQQQSELPDYCLHHKEENELNIPPNRARVYRRLTNNIMRDTLTNAYPITVAALSDEQWEALVSSFISKYKSHSPYLWKMPHGLIEHAEQESLAKKLDIPFLGDLLEFEWLEIEAQMMPDGTVPALKQDGDLEQNLIVLNPDLCLRRLKFPVFKMPAKNALKHPGTYYLSAYRNIHNFRIFYLELTPLQVFLIEALKQEALSYLDCLELLSEALGSPLDENHKQSMYQFFQTGLKRGLLLGFLANKDL